MEKITIELEAVTATFLHVEPDGEARWRAAPFRGLARWWFRAVLGAAFIPEQVRIREAEIFGTTESPSLVMVRVFDASQPSRSTRASVNPGSRHDASREALKPDSVVRVELVATAHCRNKIEALQKVYASFWTAIHLGGIGQRSRRGAGSLQMRSVEGYSGPLQPISEIVPQEHANRLSNGLREVRTTLGADKMSIMATEPPFPCLHPSFARIAVVVAPQGPDEKSVRQEIMRVRRACHRMPYQAGQAEHEFGSIRNGRLSSPLWVRVADISDSGSLLVVSLLKHAAATKMGAKWVHAEEFMNPNRWSSYHAVFL